MRIDVDSTGDCYGELTEAGNNRGFVGRNITSTDDLDLRCTMSCHGNPIEDYRIYWGTDEDDHYLAIFQETSVLFFKRVSGTYTSLASASITTAINTKYDVRITNASGAIEIFLDGVSVLTDTDSTFTTFTRVGFSCAGNATPLFAQPVRCYHMSVVGDWSDDFTRYPACQLVDGPDDVVFTQSVLRSGGRNYVLVEHRTDQEAKIYAF